MIEAKDIKHGFGKRCHNIIELFDNTNKIETFKTKLNKQSELDPFRYDPDLYKGDGFEFLIEILLKTHSCDNRIGIQNYEPIQNGVETDTGVDGIGINITDHKCVIQIKYRNNNEIDLTANIDHLSNMFSAAQTSYNVSSISSEIENLNKYKVEGLINEKNFNKKIKELSIAAPRHYVFTTANGLHHFTDNEMYKNNVKCFGYSELRKLLDGNYSFWNICRKIANQLNEEIKKIK